MITLSKLLEHASANGISIECSTGIDAPALSHEVLGLTHDSKGVKPGYLFAALLGKRVDGRSFIAGAMEAGAGFILTSEPLPPELNPNHLPVLVARRPRFSYAKLLALFYGAQPAHIAAVTGTNGKSSVTHFAQQLWMFGGKDAACFGTLGLIAPDHYVPPKDVDLSLTSADPRTLHRVASELKECGVDYLAIEASSHGLDQCRLDGLNINMGVFTNLTNDHLEYHGTMQAYLSAKTRLFRDILQPGHSAIFCADIPEADVLYSLCKERGLVPIRYGRRGIEICVRDIQSFDTYSMVHFEAFGRSFHAKISLVGEFQIMNAMAALAIGVISGLNLDKLVQNLQILKGVRGRLERVATSSLGASIYVDYAHTPDALSQMLQSIRTHCTGALHLVFGCGGERDQTKRPMMGRVAQECADHVIITDDNPRGEDPAVIRQAILGQCPKALEIPSRQEAIHKAIQRLKKGDILVVAGKGHEVHQLVQGKKTHFDDAEVICRYIEVGDV